MRSDSEDPPSVEVTVDADALSVGADVVVEEDWLEATEEEEGVGAGSCVCSCWVSREVELGRREGTQVA